MQVPQAIGTTSHGLLRRVQRRRLEKLMHVLWLQVPYVDMLTDHKLELIMDAAGDMADEAEETIDALACADYQLAVVRRALPELRGELQDMHDLLAPDREDERCGYAVVHALPRALASLLRKLRRAWSGLRRGVAYLRRCGEAQQRIRALQELVDSLQVQVGSS